MTKRDDLRKQLEEAEAKILALKDKERSTDETKEFIAAMDDADAINDELDLLDRADQTVATIRQPIDLQPNQEEPGEKQGFGSLGEYFQAIAAAQMPINGPQYGSYRSGMRDPRLSVRAATGLEESTPSLGGFMVQEDFSSQLLEAAQAQSVLYPRTRRITITSNANSLKIPGIDEASRASTRWGGIVGYWEGEGDTLTASKPKFRNVELSLKKLTGLVYVTDEMLADSSVLEAVIREGFRQEFAFQLDDKILRGTGAGQPLGILNGPSLVSVTGGSSAGTIVTADVTGVFAQMYPGSMARSRWYANVDTIPQLMGLTLNNNPLWLQDGRLADAPYGTLLGKPIDYIEQASSVGTVGDLLLLDLSQYIMIEKGGLQTAASMHVQFLTDEMVFRFILRVDGQPGWHSSLTPYKGSNALSPFVTIATRS